MKSAFLLFVAALSICAAAQDPGPPSAGPTGGAPVLKSLNQPDEGGRLLTMPAVQDDLQLTDPQKDQIKALFAKNANDGKQTTPRTVNQHIREILTPDQMKRLEEIRLQVAGLMAVLAPRIAKKLNLTDDQANKIQKMVQQARDDQKTEVPKPKHPILELRDKVEPLIRAVLTADQVSVWEGLIGRPFAFPAPKN